MVEKARAGISNPIQIFQVAWDIKVIAMKTSSFNVLAVSAAFFALCASVMAAGPNGDVPSHPLSKSSIIQTACLKCHGGASVNGDLDFTRGLTLEQKHDVIAKAASGEMPKNGPRLTPQQFSQLKKELAGMTNAGASSASNEAPPASPLAKRPAPKPRSLKATTSVSSKASTLPAPPQAHISVVRPSDDVPTARVRVVPAGSPSSKPVSKARVVVVTADDISKTAVAPPKPDVKPQPIAATTPNGTDDFNKSLDKLDTSKDDASKISDSIKGLVGDWMAVSRQGDGELSTVELQLDDHGWAKLTIPGADGKPSTATRKVELKDSQLTLTNKSGVVSLGKLVSADSRQMVLERETGLVTFVRP
jgi:hypothetical protein